MAQRADDTRIARNDAPDPLGVFGRTRPVPPSLLAVYAAVGASVGSVPMPWLPDALARRVRGALAHDVASRHGLSLTPQARDVLAEPSGPDGPRSVIAQAARFVGFRVAVRVLRFGPIGVVWPVRQALGTYLLGHLLDRYLERTRTERAARIEVEEARRVRLAIDRAVLRALTVVIAPQDPPPTIDDQRDGVEVFFDALLATAAGLPAKVIHKLEAAFDELVTQAHG